MRLWFRFRSWFRAAAALDLATRRVHARRREIHSKLNEIVDVRPTSALQPSVAFRRELLYARLEDLDDIDSILLGRLP